MSNLVIDGLGILVTSLVAAVGYLLKMSLDGNSRVIAEFKEEFSEDLRELKDDFKKELTDSIKDTNDRVMKIEEWQMMHLITMHVKE